MAYSSALCTDFDHSPTLQYLSVHGHSYLISVVLPTGVLPFMLDVAPEESTTQLYKTLSQPSNTVLYINATLTAKSYHYSSVR
jgi:hypothetical protein